MADASELRESLRRSVRAAVRDAGTRMRSDLVARTPHLRWEYGHDPRAPFPPHQALDGQALESWEDPALAASAGRFPFVGHYHPGDHAGCLCDYEVVFDRSFRTATAWQVRFHDNGRTFTAEFTNRRYEPEKLAIPAARTRAAAPGRQPIAVRSRAQVSDRVAHFYRDVLNEPTFAAQVTISLAVGR